LECGFPQWTRNECTDVDFSLHFLAVHPVLKGLIMDQLINPKHVVYAYHWECYGMWDSKFLLFFLYWRYIYQPRGFERLVKSVDFWPWRNGPSVPKPSYYPGFKINSDTLRSVGFLWTSDQPDAETCTWQLTTLAETDIHDPDVIRTHNPSKRAAANPRLRPRGHWDRQYQNLI